MSATKKYGAGIRMRFGRLCLIFLLTVAALTAGSVSGVLPAATVSAATAEKISFTDGSGKYLEKIGKAYYLRNKKGKKLTGIQYLSIPKTGNIATGHYWFDENGKLVQKRAVKYFEGVKVHGVTFSGYYFINGHGRLVTNAGGIYKLTNLKCGNKTFNGYYYVDKSGKLSNTAQLRYLKAKTVDGVEFKAGYYYFD